jgi:FkbM family methyltransferase
MALVDHDYAAYEANKRYLSQIREKLGKFTHKRPRKIYEKLLRLLSPDEVRRIVRTERGLLLYINPFNDIGRHILSMGSYEQENEELFRQQIKPGDIVLDVGANEGIFAALFGSLVGHEGKVIAVEPQSRLRDLIEINCRLNDLTNYHLFQNALGGTAGGTARIALYSGLNSGMSSLVKTYNSTTGYEDVAFITIDQILQSCGIDHLDFVKVDTEGFEVEVVHTLLPLIKTGRVGKLYVDYHDAILATRSLSGDELHAQVLKAGMTVVTGSRATKDSYILYARG